MIANVIFTVNLIPSDGCISRTPIREFSVLQNRKGREDWSLSRSNILNENIKIKQIILLKFIFTVYVLVIETY